MSLIENIKSLKDKHNIFLISSGEGYLKNNFDKLLKKKHHYNFKIFSWIAKKFDNSFLLSFLYRLLLLPFHLINFFKIFYIFKKIKCDVVITNTIYIIEPTLVAKLLKVKSFIFARELINNPYYEYNFSKKFIVKFILKNTNFLCFNSTTTQNSFNEFIEKKELKKCHVIPNIIKKNKSNKNLKKYLNLKNDNKVILTASWINKTKKIEDFIKLSKNLNNQFTFVLFGDYGSDNIYNKKIKKLLMKNKHIIHKKSLPNIQSYMSSADYIVSMGYMDSFNRLIAEAMLEKSIVLTLKHSACKDYIKNDYNGYLLNKISDFEKIIKKIDKNKKKKYQIKLNAYNTINNKFSNKAVLQKLEKLIYE